MLQDSEDLANLNREIQGLPDRFSYYFDDILEEFEHQETRLSEV